MEHEREPEVGSARAELLTASLTLSKGVGAAVGASRIALLEAVEVHGSIAGAAKAVGLSYKGAWDAAQAINNLFDAPLIVTRTGGRGGGLAAVTVEGRALITTFRAAEVELARVIDTLGRRLSASPDLALSSLLWSLTVKTSARNALRGKITQITDGAVNAEIVLELAPGIEIVAILTRHSVEDLGLAVGKSAIALIKASSIIIVPGTESLRTSARNQLTGTLSECEDGAVNSEVRLDLGGGKSLTAIITRRSRQELGLEAGQRVSALIKSSQVILAVE